MAGSWKELFSDFLLARYGFPDKITLELLTSVVGVTLFTVCPTGDGSCEVVGLIMLSKGISGGVVAISGLLVGIPAE